jgi:hypothetical protein
MTRISFATWSSTFALVCACSSLPDTIPPDVDGAGQGGGSSGGSAGAAAGTVGKAGTGGTAGGGAGVGGATGGSAGKGGTSGAGGAGAGAGGAGAGGEDGGMGGKGGAGGAGMGGSAGKGGSAGGGTGGAQAGGGAGGTSGKGGSGGAGAPNGGMSGKGGAAGMGGAGASSGGKGGMGMGGVPMELAHDRPSTADSEENVGGTTARVNISENGNDGDDATRWCAANGMPHYWQVDLGAVHTLTRVEIDFEYPPQADGAAYAYVVTVSPDGTTFGPGVDRSTNTSTTATQTATFPANISGRHVRIAITPPDTSPNTWASFWEARIYGY